MKAPRLSMMRPAIFTAMAAASSSSLLLPSYCFCRSAHRLSRRKSLGKAMPCSRTAASFSLRWAISLFSSCCSSFWSSCWSLMVALSAWRVVQNLSRRHWQAPTDGLLGLQTLLEAGLEVAVEVAVEHLLAIAAFDAGTQVLDARVIEHVGANLVTPADIRLAVFQRLRGGVALLHFQLVQLGPQHLHRGVLVGVLGTFVLAGHHGVGRHVGDTHRRVGGVDVLTTGARGAVGVDAQVGRVDLDFDLVVDLGGHEHRRERGVATGAGIERALAHQTVHADLGAQPAEGILALDMHGGALDAGDFTFGQLDDLGTEAALVGPAQVHAQKDVGPVLGFGATGAGLDVQVAVVGVHLAAEHAAEFQLLEDFAQALDFGDDVVHRSFVIFLGSHFQQIPGIGQAAGEVVDGFDDLRQHGALAAQRLCVLGFVPDAGVFQLAVYFDQTIMLLIVVKDTPELTGFARTGP